MTVTFLNLMARSTSVRSRTFATEDAYVAWLNNVGPMVEILSAVAS